MTSAPKPGLTPLQKEILYFVLIIIALMVTMIVVVLIVWYATPPPEPSQKEVLIFRTGVLGFVVLIRLEYRYRHSLWTAFQLRWRSYQRASQSL